MDTSVGRQLSITAKTVKAWFDQHLADHGSSLTTWIVLSHALAAEPPGLSQKAMADEMGIGGPALVRHIDRLEAEGLVERSRDPDDRRITRVTATAAGRRHHAELAKVAADGDAEIRSVLSEREATTLLRALQTLHDHFAALPPGGTTRTTRTHPTEAP
ncbi:MAG: MarR family transcriptional regulator [Acidimicrobiales bacterium]